MKTSSEPTYPIAEIFASIQGEGRYTGTAMTFVRFAGCTVGKPYGLREQPVGLQVYQEKCTTWDGRVFACDTNYKMAERLSVAEIQTRVLALSPHRLCFTGGEPLMHKDAIERLVKDLLIGDMTASFAGRLPHFERYHIETSGTIEWSDYLSDFCWVAVSPKAGCTDKALTRADEIKVLVGDGFDEGIFHRKFEPYFHKVLLSPINGVADLNREHHNRCLELITKYPELSLSIQLHKVLGVR